MLLFFKPRFFELRSISQIVVLFASMFFLGCSGSRKYFKAAEKLEKQGLVNEAADYYLESLQRKPTNVDAKIKLKEVGQKYVSNLASDFFRNYNTQQLEASLDSYERLKDFSGKTAGLGVILDYPKGYEEDYQKVVETFCARNYNTAYALVSQKKYNEALVYLNLVKKYNPSYKTTQDLETVAICEPLYQNAVNCLENKNYAGAYNLLSSIKNRTDNYKDSRDLYELASAGQSKSFILFAPKSSGSRSERDLQEYIFNNFNQVANQKFEHVKIINNTPFTYLPNINEGSAAGVDLIQAIRKATGADFFYSYDISNKKEYNSGISRQPHKGFQEVKTRKNDTLTITEYKPFDYFISKGNRSFGYQYNYKLINAYNNQIVSSQSQNVIAQDAVEYQEFAKGFNANVNSLFPYNPQQTAPAAKYNPSAWRKAFAANTALKTFEQLSEEANNKTIGIFSNSVLNNIR
jgi:hypothetical protein